MERQKYYLDYLIHPSFRGVNRLFVLSDEDEAQQTGWKRYYLPTVEIKNYNVMIDGQNFFDQPLRNNLMTYDRYSNEEMNNIMEIVKTLLESGLLKKGVSN